MPPRFFLSQDLSCHTKTLLPKKIVHHIRVLRLEEESIITLFNGQGGEYQAKLCEFNKHSAKAQVLEFFPYERELPFAITLAQAITSGNKMDWLIEKAIELGISAIQPLDTSRCVVKLTGKRAEQRVTHWQELVHAACEQCGRNQIPMILPIRPLKEWLIQSPCSRGLLLSPRATMSLYDSVTLIRSLDQFTVLVGPEGGFSADEEALVQKHEFSQVKLGNRILRCETAGLAAIAGITALLNGC